jgi:hypothetical protein
MQIEDIKAAVDAARERSPHLGTADSHNGFENWLIENLQQADAALIALWEQTQEQESNNATEI